MADHLHKAEALPIIFKHKLVDYKGTPMHEDYASMMPEVEALQCCDKDILLASYHKTGSTWLESILTLIVNNGDPESLAEGNELSKKYKKFAFMEFKWSIFPSEFGGPRREIDLIKEQSSPRTMRTHLPYSLLPQDVERNHPKILYIYRDVKDLMVSHYYHYKYHPHKMVDRLGTFEEFAEDFMAGRIAYGSYFAHLHSYWVHRHEPNFFVISYEALLKDHRGKIEQIAAFLNMPLTEKEADNIVHRTSKEQMKLHNDETWRTRFTVKDEHGNLLHHFIRTGHSGGWKSEFSPALAAKTDAWVAENLRLYAFDTNPFEC